MRILLVRHGESKGNVDKMEHHRVADHAIDLSERGRLQAAEAGKFLNEWFLKDPYYGAFAHPEGKFDCRVWASPYARTRQTAKIITENFLYRPKFGYRENINLCEQQFGLFDGLEDDELAKQYPREHAHYQKCQDFEGRFWARMPLGESRFDVAVRVHQAFGTFWRDAEKHRIHTLVVVSHGATIRAFLMQWFHHTPEWFEAEKNPKNCSIRLIEGRDDRGYIFEPTA